MNIETYIPEEYDFNSEQQKETIKFVDKDTMNSGVEEVDDNIVKLYKEKSCLVIDRLKGIGLPSAGEQIRMVTKRTFNSIAFLEWVIESEGEIEEAVLAIYSITFEAAVLINRMIETGKIKTATILMSNLRNVAYRKKEEMTKKFFVDNPNVELIFASSHAKIMSFKTKMGNYYTVEGSGNLSYNSRIEQYVIDNDKVLFDFTKNWIEEIKVYLKEKKELSIYPKDD